MTRFVSLAAAASVLVGACAEQRDPAVGMDAGGPEGGAACDGSCPGDVPDHQDAGVDVPRDGGPDGGAVNDGGDAGVVADASQSVEDGGAPVDAAQDGDACVADPACDDGNECTCNPRLPDGGCTAVNRPNCMPCQLGTGYCLDGACTDACVHLDDDCNVGVCDVNAAGLCDVEPKADCTPCADGAGLCSDGECLTETCPDACDPEVCEGE
jgi:hypothetical protein